MNFPIKVIFNYASARHDVTSDDSVYPDDIGDGCDSLPLWALAVVELLTHD